MRCQFCGTRIRSPIYGCKNCKPVIISVDFEEPNLKEHNAKQIAVVIRAYGMEYAGYLPLKTPEG